MAGFQPIQRIKNALDNRKLSLTAPAPGAPDKKANLSFMVAANNPRIVVYTNDPNDQGASSGYGKITANLDAPVFATFLGMLRKAIAHTGEVRYRIENKNFIFPGGKRSDAPVVVSELIFGKDAEGIVWMSVIAKDRPKIKFKFAPTDFHFLQNGDGTPLAEGEVSCLYATGFLNVLEHMVPMILVSEYKEPEKKDNGNKGGGNSYGNKPSYQNNSSSDSDIPF